MIQSATSSNAHPSADLLFPFPLLVALIAFQLSSVALTRAFHPTSFFPLGYSRLLGLGANRMASFEYDNDSSNKGETPVGVVVVVREGLVNGNQAAMRFKKSDAWLLTVEAREWGVWVSPRENLARSSVRLAVMLQSSRETWSVVVRDDEEGENAVGAASKKVASRSGCSWV